MGQDLALADADAQIAHDLRREGLGLMHQGKSSDEVVAFRVARYGEFVRYKPAVEPSTWLLWFGPALLLVGGGIVLVRIVRARSRREVPAPAVAQEWRWPPSVQSQQYWQWWCSPPCSGRFGAGRPSSFSAPSSFSVCRRLHRHS